MAYCRIMLWLCTIRFKALPMCGLDLCSIWRLHLFKDSNLWKVGIQVKFCFLTFSQEGKKNLLQTTCYLAWKGLSLLIFNYFCSFFPLSFLKFRIIWYSASHIWPIIEKYFCFVIHMLLSDLNLRLFTIHFRSFISEPNLTIIEKYFIINK